MAGKNFARDNNMKRIYAKEAHAKPETCFFQLFFLERTAYEMKVTKNVKVTR